jgi:hypothetical protein
MVEWYIQLCVFTRCGVKDFVVYGSESHSRGRKRVIQLLHTGAIDVSVVRTVYDSTYYGTQPLNPIQLCSMHCHDILRVYSHFQRVDESKSMNSTHVLLLVD